nr:hypothetical protein [Treponema sp.]
MKKFIISMVFILSTYMLTMFHVFASDVKWVQDEIMYSSDGKTLYVSSFASSIEEESLSPKVETIRTYSNNLVEKWLRNHGWMVCSVSPDYTEFSRTASSALKINGMEAGDEYWSIKRKKLQSDWINTTDVTGSFSSNKEAQDYEIINDVTKSFLVPFDDGSMMLVRAEEELLICYLDKNFKQLKELNVKMELPLFGGFFASSDGFYYVIEGRNNDRDSDKSEVIRIIKYNSDWTRVNSCS